MSFFDSAKRFASAITLLSASIISIGFSSWQFQYDTGDLKWFPESWDDICTSFPIDMLRPVVVGIKGSDDKPSYCGYSNANTGYRLAVALITLFFSVAIFFRVFEERPAILSASFWGLYSLWFLAAGLDVVSIANGQAACQEDEFTVSGGTKECNNSIYGITIAIDAAICVVLGVFIYLQAVAGIGLGGSSAIPTNRGSSTLQNVVV
eukprot:gene7679-8292_t